MHDNTNPEFNFVQICIDIVDKVAIYGAVDCCPFERQVMEFPQKPEVEAEIVAVVPGVDPIPYEERFILKHYIVRGKDGMKLDSSMIMNALDENGVEVINFGENIEIMEETGDHTPDFLERA